MSDVNIPFQVPRFPLRSRRLHDHLASSSSSSSSTSSSSREISPLDSLFNTLNNSDATPSSNFFGIQAGDDEWSFERSSPSSPSCTTSSLVSPSAFGDVVPLAKRLKRAVPVRCYAEDTKCASDMTDAALNTSATVKKNGKEKDKHEAANATRSKRNRRKASEVERSHKCPYCPKKYGTSNAMNGHINIKHTDEKGKAYVPCHSAIPTTTILESAAPAPDTSTTSSSPTHVEDPHLSPLFSSTSWSSSSSSSLSSSSSSVVSVAGATAELHSAPLSYTDCPQLDRHTHTPSKVSAVSNIERPLAQAIDSEIPLLQLSIGRWKMESLYCGDIVARFLYDRRHLVCECAQSDTVLKLEFDFDSVVEFQLRDVEVDGVSASVITLLTSAAPSFYEATIEPHTPLVWRTRSDFTDNQASSLRWHHLYLLRDALCLPLQALQQREPRIRSLIEESSIELATTPSTSLEQTTACDTQASLKAYDLQTAGNPTLLSRQIDLGELHKRLQAFVAGPSGRVPTILSSWTI